MSGVLHGVLGCLGGPPGTVTVSGHTISAGAAVNGVRVNSDGTIDEMIDGSPSQIDSSTDWIIPNASASGEFEVLAHINSGTLSTSAGLDTWLPLSSNRLWDTTATCNLQISIRYQGGATLSSGAYALG